MIIVLICGASGSGKTALATNIAQELNNYNIDSRVIALDSYYMCHPELPFEERTRINYDSPHSFDFDLLKSDVDLLAHGQCITTKVYDYALHLRHDTSDLISAPQVLILEGIHAFADTDLLKNSDLRIYVDTDPDVCIVRRMCRDVKNRERTVDAIAEQYLDTVKPMFDKYIKQYRNSADVCVVGGGHNMRAVRVAALYIMSLI